MSTNNFPHPFNQLKELLTEYARTLPMKVSAMAENEFKENFRRHGYRDKSGNIDWKKRSNDSENDKGRGILVKSGRLSRGFRKRPTEDTAVVVNEVPYAKAHNEGDTSTVNVKAFTRSIRKVVVRSSNRISKKVTIQKMILPKPMKQEVKEHSRKNDLPARPFMKTTKPLLDEIDKEVLQDVTNIFNSIKK